MTDGIPYQNKDVLFKVLSQNYENKSFQVLGLNLPKIKKVLPTNLPKVTATELRADNIFLLEDDRILIVDYESKVKTENFLKYLEYSLAVLKMYYNMEKKIFNIVVAVIYTGDIKYAQNQFITDSVKLDVVQVFLSSFDTDKMYSDLEHKVATGIELTDEDIMRFIILPLTEPTANGKQPLIEKTINLAKDVKDEQQQIFIVAGILVATDKIIDRHYSNMVKEWISMTKVARLFEEEKIEAVNEAVKNEKLTLVKEMTLDGEDVLKIMKYTKLTKQEISKIQSQFVPSLVN